MFAGDWSGGSGREPRFGHVIRHDVNIDLLLDLVREPEIEVDVGGGILVRIASAVAALLREAE